MGKTIDEILRDVAFDYSCELAHCSKLYWDFRAQSNSEQEALFHLKKRLEKEIQFFS